MAESEQAGSRAEQLSILKQGVAQWNRWREENPQIPIDLSGEELTGVKLRDANLENANLENARGFRSGQLGGANLTGAKLPEDVRKFDALKNVEELSQAAKKLFITMLGACVYSWLTIATTTDVRLITNSASSPLPIIQTPIPIAWFYIAAPLLLVCIYLYFHFYMQRLWEGLAELPAFFPDGASLDKKAHPWLLNGLVRSHFALLKKGRPALSGLQVRLAGFLAWWVVPLTLLLFWWRYLFRHDLPISVLQIALLMLSIGTATFLSHLAAETLSGAERRTFAWRKAYRDTRTYEHLAVEGGLGIALFFVCSMAICGSDSRFTSYINSECDPYMIPNTIQIRGREVVSVHREDGKDYDLTPWVRNYFRADLIGTDVSEKPENWTGREDDAEVQIALTKAAQLSGRNLRGATASGAFFVKANLEGADLREATLQVADLRGAILGGADLREAVLRDADLRGADLVRADLREANLTLANLRGANLVSADLREASLGGADLREADLDGADLRGSDLVTANLREANLTLADLRGAYLRDADLREADLRGADLGRADLRIVRNLTADQVKGAENWESALYGDELAEQLGLPDDHNEKVFQQFPEVYNPDGSRKP